MDKYRSALGVEECIYIYIYIYISKIILTLYRIFLKIKFNIPFHGTTILANCFIKDYKNKKLPYFETFKIHNKGFTVNDWIICQLDNNNYKNYMTNAQYCGMHPMNGRYTHWIDDKLTLKYLCTGLLDEYMAKYYFLISNEGIVNSLPDYKQNNDNTIDFQNIVNLLKESKVLALKRVAGSLGEGFYKAEYKDNIFYLNEIEYSESSFINKLRTFKEYIIMEYLEPHEELAKYCPDTVNCLRYLVGKIDGKLELIKSYIRFGNKNSGFVENYNAGGVLCYLNSNGEFNEGNILNMETSLNTVIKNHPDNGIELKGKIPHWNDIVSAVEKFGNVFPEMSYLGFDFVVTKDNRVIILEINSLTSYDALNLNGSILTSKEGEFFRRKLSV